MKNMRLNGPNGRAVASAQLGAPVSVSVTPGDRPNVAVRIPETEQRKADTTPSGSPPIR